MYLFTNNYYNYLIYSYNLKIGYQPSQEKKKTNNQIKNHVLLTILFWVMPFETINDDC